MQRLALAGWLAVFLASIDPIGEASATAHTEYIFTLTASENVCTRGVKSTLCLRVYEIASSIISINTFLSISGNWGFTWLVD